MPRKTDDLKTTGQIAAECGEPNRDRVDNVIRTHNIEPARRAGVARMFDDEAVDRIKKILRARDDRRASRSPVTV